MIRNSLFFLVITIFIIQSTSGMQVAWKGLLFANIKAHAKTHVSRDEQEQAREKMEFLNAQKETYNWRWQQIEALQDYLKTNKGIEIIIVKASDVNPNAQEEKSTVFIKKEFLNCSVAELERLERKFWYLRGKKQPVLSH